MIFLAAFVLLYRLRQFDEPTGTDGFFYLKQIQSLSESFSFYYHDYSFGFFLPSVLNLVLKDPLLSYHLSSSLIWLGIGYYCLVHVESFVGKKPFEFKVFTLILILLLTFNTLSIELGLVFLKTGTALLLFFISWHFFNRQKYVGAICFALLSLASHKTMILIVPLFLAPHLLPFLRNRKIYIGVSVILLAAITLIIYPRFYNQLVHLLREGFFWQKFQEGRYPKPELLLYLILFTTFAVSMIFQKKIRHFPIIIILLLPFFSPGILNSDSLAYRFLIIGFPFFLVSVGRGLVTKGKTQIVCFVFLLANMGLSYYFYRPLSTWLNPWGKRIEAADKLTTILPPRALLYAPHGLEFYLAWKTPLRPRSLRLDRKDREEYRVAFIRPYTQNKSSLLYQDIIQTSLLNMGPEFSLFKESDWLNLNTIHQFQPHAMNLLPKKPDFVPDYDD